MPGVRSGSAPVLDRCFVFGSNEGGIHGAGSALAAYKHHGAVWGVGHGLRGRCYGIPTKDARLKTLPLSKVEEYVRTFLLFAATMPNVEFNVVKIGCGLAGFSEAQIAPLFSEAPRNCKLPFGWRKGSM